MNILILYSLKMDDYLYLKKKSHLIFFYFVCECTFHFIIIIFSYILHVEPVERRDQLQCTVVKTD